MNGTSSYEGTSTEPRYKFLPGPGPVDPQQPVLLAGPGARRLDRGPQLPFRVLTQPLALLVERSEKSYEALKKANRSTSIDDTDMFLLYNTQGLVDKNLHQLQEMSRKDPEKPRLSGPGARLPDPRLPGPCPEALN